MVPVPLTVCELPVKATWPPPTVVTVPPLKVRPLLMTTRSPLGTDAVPAPPLPRVTLSSVPESTTSMALPLVVMVAPLIVPPLRVRLPVAVESAMVPAPLTVPLTTMVPPVALRDPRPAVVSEPPRFRVPPLVASQVPWFV